MKNFLQVQVTFKQGLVKLFLAPESILAVDFKRAIEALGKTRSLRFLPDVTEESARILVSTGNAVMVEARRG